MTPSERFWLKVRIVLDSGSCWVWQGKARSDGYCRFWLNGQNVYAHRHAWRLKNGREPYAGHIIMHLCDNRACVRPDHLREALQVDNIVDMHTKHRWDDRNGEKHPLAKLTDKQALQLRDLEGQLSAKEAAKTYGISPRTVHHIWHRSRWGKVV